MRTRKQLLSEKLKREDKFQISQTSANHGIFDIPNYNTYAPIT